MNNLRYRQQMLKDQADTLDKSSNQQMAPQQMAPQQMAPQQMAPQQMTPQQMAPQQMAPQQMAPQQMVPQQMVPQQMVHQQMTPQQQEISLMMDDVKVDKIEMILSKKQLALFLVLLTVLFVVLSLPQTFKLVGENISGGEWVSPDIEQHLNYKLVLVHGVVFLLLSYGISMLIKKGTFDD